MFKRLLDNPVAVIILALLYILSPIDLIPDFIPFLGWVDDLGVAGLALRRLIKFALWQRSKKQLK